MSQDGAQPGNEQWRWDGAGNPLDRHTAAHVMHNRVTELNGIRWQYDIHGRTTEKDDGHTRWRYRYDGEHRLTEVISEPRDRNKPRTKVSFRYDPLGRRISKTSQQLLQGSPSGNAVTTRFVWEGYRLLQEIHDGTPLTYVYSDSQSYEPLARIDGVESPEIYWFHNAANGMPELLTDAEGQKAWEGINSPWGKLLRESSQRMPVVQQNLRMQGQYLDRETGLHYNLFRYYDPDSGRFTQQDPIGLAGGINLYQYAPNALGWVDPWGLSKCKSDYKYDMVNNPGPLANLKGNPAANFAGGKYNMHVLEHDLVLYRAGKGGGGINALGQWFTREPAESVAKVRVELAVKPQWIDEHGVLTGTSPIESVYKIVIPKGTTIYEGPVGYQGGAYLGGQNITQIFVEQPWRLNGVNVLDSWPIR